MHVSASLRKRIDKFMRDFGFSSFQIEEGEIVLYKPTPQFPSEPFVIREFTKDSEIRKIWTELQLDFESEN